MTTAQATKAASHTPQYSTKAAFRPAAISSERVRRVAERVSVTIDPELVSRDPTGPLTTATIRLKGGDALEGENTIVRGDYGNRVPREELVEKFHFLADDILGAQRSAKVLGAVERLEALPDIRDLTGLLGG